MKNANILAGFIFGLTGLVNALSSNWISASLFLALAAASLLMDAASARSRDLVINASLVPAWRRISVLLLLGVSSGLFGFQVGHDLKAKVNASNAPQTSQHR